MAVYPFDPGCAAAVHETSSSTCDHCGTGVPVVMVDEFQLWGGKAPRPFHKGSSHLTVDGESDEQLAALHELAQRIGLRRSWFQPKSTPHYDLVESKRAQALRAGAVFVPSRGQAEARIARRRERA